MPLEDKEPIEWEEPPPGLYPITPPVIPPPPPRFPKGPILCPPWALPPGPPRNPGIDPDPGDGEAPPPDGQFVGVSDTQVLSLAWRSNAFICKVTDTMVACLWKDSAGNVKFDTRAIDAAGLIANAATDTQVIALANDVPEGFAHLIGNVYVFVTEGAAGEGTISTIEITDAGAIGAAVLDSWDCAAANFYNPSMIAINEGVVAFAYQTAIAAGTCSTVTISAAGIITNAWADTDTITTNASTGHHICLVAGDVYAVVSRSNPNRVYLSTFEISAAGLIDVVGLDELELTVVASTAPRIAKAQDGMYAVTYHDASMDGWILSIGITNGGVIAAAVSDTLEFDGDVGLDSFIVHMGNGMELLFYTGPGTDGWSCTIQVAGDGGIGAAPEDTLEFDAVNCIEPVAAHIFDNIYGVCYLSGNNVVTLKTLEVT